jgi:tetratricopeptide (TPR) repeat protein
MMALAFALALFGAPQSAKTVDVPPACIGATFVSWQACADAADEGTPPYALAMINLGAEAYMRRDYASALRYYDKADTPGQTISSDVIFHTFRGDTYRHAGRTAAAAEDARLAWMYLDGRPPAGIDPRDLRPIDDELRFFVLTLILPILKDGDAAVFEQARTTYADLPLDASDWGSLSNRATVLMDLGDFPAAIADSKRAVDLQPADAGLQNNHCYILTMAGQPGAGLSHCERAVALLPEAAPIRHSYAAALAGVGRCEDAERQLAEARRLDPSGVIYRETLACTPK